MAPVRCKLQVFRNLLLFIQFGKHIHGQFLRQRTDKGSSKLTQFWVLKDMDFFFNEHCFFKAEFHLYQILSRRRNESHRLYKSWVLKHLPTLINHTDIVPFENLMNTHSGRKSMIGKRINHLHTIFVWNAKMTNKKFQPVH